ncbi:Ig-like domain-containing protein [Candidatus Woesearchaeota archaeon]|nr:Ig-like domain-containing protein [Candidatus Woesearchaeota archaeon]
MNKRVALLVTIFLVLPPIVFSIPTFTIQETEKVSLQANATDPDSDKITTTYTSPLNENGEWQTTYGDAGEYTATVTASDGTTSVSEDVLIVVKKKEETPAIESFAPAQEMPTIKETESIGFSVLATDLNKDELEYKWFLDGKEAKEGNEYTYGTTYNDGGSHEIRVEISDGTTSISKEWDVDVENVDVEGLLDGIEDAAFNENEIVKLKLPDFEKYGMVYSISEPVGSKNEWQTGYNDAGNYDVKIHAEGKGFSGDKTVKVIVNDVDRTLIFESIGNKVLNENEEIKITLNAHDDDNDEITYSAENLPEDAEFEGNVFTWKTSYYTVKKDGFVDRLLDKFRILSKSFYVRFTASSKDKKIVQNIIITVKDVNRAPVLEDIEPITINEGDTLRIAPNAYDLDGDRVKLGYSGFINTDTFKSGFDDAGAYNVKVTASDGTLETSKLVQVNIKQSNRAPVFEKIGKISSMEGDNIAVLLNAHDPDNDEITYSVDNQLEGYSLKGNAFLWTPSYDIANKKETKKFDIVFVASDDKAETRQIAKAEVTDKNRAPKIINATKSIAAKVNEPVLMSVNAVDDDGDTLTYEWRFGFLEKYKATALHQRIFKSKGLKTVKVTVSDGTDKAEQVISVNVV